MRQGENYQRNNHTLGTIECNEKAFTRPVRVVYVFET